VIHRDLKPANALLTRTGVPKITDFGLAKDLPGKAGGGTGRQLTEIGAVLGSPPYMAPEQASGQAGKVGTATDVYALGAILYEMLTGRPPFLAESPLETLLQVLRNEPVPPADLHPKVPADLETICLKCLAKDAGKRYASADALARDLERFLRGEPIQARPAGVGERLVKWARRRPALAVLSLGLLVLTVLGFGLVTWQWLRADYLRGQAEEASRRAILLPEQAEEAERKATATAGREARARRRAQLLAAGLALDQGLSQIARGDASQGLLWLARSLEMAPADADAWQRAARLNLAAYWPQVRPVRLFLEHGEAVNAVALRPPDGQVIVTSGADGLVRRWDATGRPIDPPLDHGRPVNALAFSRDGKFLVAGTGYTDGRDDYGEARLWKTAGTAKSPGGSGKLVHTFKHPGAVRAVAFSPDGRLIATVGGGG
jgi:hypothetical protein